MAGALKLLGKHIEYLEDMIIKNALKHINIMLSFRVFFFVLFAVRLRQNTSKVNPKHA